MSKRRKPFSMGLTSLFAVLIVLCLVVFAVLSQLTAKSELALAQRAADTVMEAYNAEYRAVVYGETAPPPTTDDSPGYDMPEPGQRPWEVD
ncbi:MAG: hypothetical protein FWG45_01315 [Oscillospiraceae bacterium]|nr:hypothetical protein [Oscillospiraceae bacterium]